MNRNFTLNEVSYEEFSELCQKAESEPRKLKSNMKYARLRNSVSYRNIQHLLGQSRDDDFQYLRCAWYPYSMPLSDARKRTLLESEGYFQFLVDNEAKYKILVLELLKKDARKGAWFDQDFFEFVKVDSNWNLRFLRIRGVNAGIYVFSGISVDFNNPRDISGIYAGE